MVFILLLAVFTDRCDYGHQLGHLLGAAALHFLACLGSLWSNLILKCFLTVLCLIDWAGKNEHTLIDPTESSPLIQQQA